MAWSTELLCNLQLGSTANDTVLATVVDASAAEVRLGTAVHTMKPALTRFMSFSWLLHQHTNSQSRFHLLQRRRRCCQYRELHVQNHALSLISGTPCLRWEELMHAPFSTQALHRHSEGSASLIAGSPSRSRTGFPSLEHGERSSCHCVPCAHPYVHIVIRLAGAAVDVMNDFVSAQVLLPVFLAALRRLPRPPDRQLLVFAVDAGALAECKRQHSLCLPRSGRARCALRAASSSSTPCLMLAMVALAFTSGHSVLTTACGTVQPLSSDDCMWDRAGVLPEGPPKTPAQRPPAGCSLRSLPVRGAWERRLASSLQAAA